MTTRDSESRARSLLARLAPPALTGAFGTALVMWSLWFVTHLPAIDLPTPVVAALFAVVMVAGALLTARRADPDVPGLPLGLLVGVVTSLINLLVLGSLLTEALAPLEGASDAQTAARPGAAVILLGFFTFSAVLGSVGGLLGQRLRPQTPAGWGDLSPTRGWLAYFAIIAAVAILTPIITGGAVTSTDAGMSVPDWPGTYGSNMFLFPLALMADHRIYFEHTHRLFGSFVGLTTLVLLGFALRAEPRKWVKILAASLFALVVLQGIFGGTRVTENLRGLAIIHGVLGQLVFALAAVLAAVMSPAFDRALSGPPAEHARTARRFRGIATAAFHTTILQLVLGATFRHFHSMHALWTHAVVAVLVVALAVAAGFMAMRLAREVPSARSLRPIGGAIVGLVGVQFVLGWIALFAVLAGGDRGPVPTADRLASTESVPVLEALVASVHQSNGAILLALLAAQWALARALSRAPAGAENRAPARHSAADLPGVSPTTGPA